MSELEKIKGTSASAEIEQERSKGVSAERRLDIERKGTVDKTVKTTEGEPADMVNNGMFGMDFEAMQQVLVRKLFKGKAFTVDEEAWMKKAWNDYQSLAPDYQNIVLSAAKESATSQLADVFTGALNKKMLSNKMIKNNLYAMIAETDPDNPLPLYNEILSIDGMQPPKLQQSELPQPQQLSTDPVQNQMIIGIASNILGSIGGLVSGQAAEGVAAGAAGAEAAVGVARQDFDKIVAQNRENEKFLMEYSAAQDKNIVNFSNKYLEQVGQNQRKLLEEYNDRWIKERQFEIDRRANNIKADLNQIKLAAGQERVASKNLEAQMKKLEIALQNARVKTKFHEELAKAGNAAARAAFVASMKAESKRQDYMQKYTKEWVGDYSAISKTFPTVTGYGEHLMQRLDYSARASGKSPDYQWHAAKQEGDIFNSTIMMLRSMTKSSWMEENKDVLASTIFPDSVVDPNITATDYIRKSISGMVLVAEDMRMADHLQGGEKKPLNYISNIKAKTPLELIKIFANVDTFSRVNIEEGEKQLGKTGKALSYLAANGSLEMSRSQQDLTGLVQGDILLKMASDMEKSLDEVTGYRVDAYRDFMELAVKERMKTREDAIRRIMKEKNKNREQAEEEYEAKRKR